MIFSGQDIEPYIGSKPAAFVMGAVMMASAIPIWLGLERAATEALHNAELKYQQYAHAVEVAALEETLSNLEPRIGDGEFYDVSRHFLTKFSKIPASSTFFGNDRFYAIKSSDKWAYKKMTESEFITSTFDPESQFAKYILKYSKNEPSASAVVHFWRGINDMKVMIVKGKFPYRRLFPYISVERFVLDKFIEMTKQSRAKQNYVYDPIGAMISTLTAINTNIGTRHEDVTPIIVALQKGRNSAYIKYKIVVNDLKVKSTNLSTTHLRYYLLEHTIILRTKDDLYLIRWRIPTTDPNRSVYVKWVNHWLAHFYVDDQY